MNIKKALALCLAAVIIVAIPVIGSTTDFSFIKDYSDEELQALRQEIDAEILSRDIPTYAELMATQYVAGRDIPAGRYAMTFVSNDKGRSFINYYIYEKEEDYSWDASEAIVRNSVSENDSPTIITLEEGNMLVFFDGVIKLEKAPILWK